MYRYDPYDQKIVDERVAQFRDQTRRYLAGELTDDEFRPLRLQNGLYIQRHAPMLRVAVPYGLLSTRSSASWPTSPAPTTRATPTSPRARTSSSTGPSSKVVPEILAELATVEMHAIQTSGNCIRNITSDPFAGVAGDEIHRPAPLVRSAAPVEHLPPGIRLPAAQVQDCREWRRARPRGHPVPRHRPELKRDAAGEIGFQVLVGGGMGRTPIIGAEISDFVPWQHIITYCEAILRVYNRYGRRDNLYKARIKILVKALGIAEFKRQVEEEWAFGKNGPSTLTEAEVARVAAHFTTPAYASLPAEDADYAAQRSANPAFAAWARRNVLAHKVPGYAVVVLSLKDPRARARRHHRCEQMELAADLADATASAKCASPTNRTWCWPTCRQRDLFASGTGQGWPAWPRRPSAC
jgi:sulfite reductase (NADPH) hemoprotein beta-component